jgi:spore germination cell wall hydrolase CwlJ-like protein
MGKAERDELRRQLNQAQGSSEVATPVLKQRYRLYDIDSEARDYLIRTIVFEGGGETEMAKAALAHVILNRQRAGKWGAKIKEVVMHPWQFEPWMTRREEIENLSSNDPRYKDTAEIVDSVLAGRVPDPTAGATYFLNPVVVRKRRGGSLPLWADGEGRPIGRHVFYSPNDLPGRSVMRRSAPPKSQFMVGG